MSERSYLKWAKTTWYRYVLISAYTIQQDPPKLIQIQVIPARVKPIQFDADFTYLLSGGLGGLGRSIAQWMVRQGAKNIVFLSRSGNKKLEAKDTIRALRNRGANIAAYSCDIANTDEVQSVLNRCAKDFPPIRGAIQGAMVLKVCSQNPCNTTLGVVLIQTHRTQLIKT